MMTFWRFNPKIYPLIGLGSSLFIIVFGLVTASSLECSYFLLGAMVWLALFGCLRYLLRVLPLLIIVGGLFAGIAYLSSGEAMSALRMLNRFGAIFLALVPGLAIEPVALTRNLSQIRAPRSLTLGMLIALSFLPLLRIEIRRVREAMKTRGAGSVVNPRIFYRAFLVPLVMRLVNISDTLALSVETRGYTLDRSPYSIYRKNHLVLSDLIYSLGIVVGAVLAVVL